MDPANIKHEMEQLNALYGMGLEFLLTYGFQVLAALLIFIIGLIVANKASQLVHRLCIKKQVDVTLAGFTASTVKLLLTVVFVIIALSKVGISIGPFVAALGAASLGIGLAVQGPLSNYGAGLNLILTHPFIIGDTITVQGVSGVVKVIKLAYTRLIDEDGVEITIPNKHIVGEVLLNSKSFTLLELTVGIRYQDDTERAIEVLTQAFSSSDYCDKSAQIGIDEFADSSINLSIRLLAPSARLHEAKFKANILIINTLKTHNIGIPLPQRELRLLQ